MIPARHAWAPFPVWIAACRRRPARYVPILLFALVNVGTNRGDAGDSPFAAPLFRYRVVASFPHDPTAFTQGLAMVDGQLFESTGRYGASALRRVDLVSGRIEQETRLVPHLFGEGMTPWQGRLVQLTWREGLGIVYDRNSLEPRELFRYSGEGWGLAQDGQYWILSDGTAVLRFLDPASRRVVRRLTVRDGARPVRFLNELEYIAGEIWANVWQQDYLVRIAPDSGAVTGYLDLGGLYPASARTDRDAVLNGIAHEATTDRLYVTGKYWPRLYQIEVVPQ